MLAAESAWRVLTAEHDQMRLYVRAITRRLETHDWSRAAEVRQIRALVNSLRHFDDRHRAKGPVLFAALRMHGDETCRFLDEIEAEGDECSRRLSLAVDRLNEVDSAKQSSVDDCVAAFRAHASLLSKHLDREDGELRRRALSELEPDDWSQIISSISAQLKIQQHDTER